MGCVVMRLDGVVEKQPWRAMSPSRYNLPPPCSIAHAVDSYCCRYFSKQDGLIASRMIKVPQPLLLMSQSWITIRPSENYTEVFF